MKSLTRIPKHLLRRGESGQAIIILAIGFVALLAFVGIVTDVSLLFVRYNTLRRAVDAASIAAAGQMRQDKSFATVSLAARQYIEFYGLDPVRVDVETCANVPDYNSDGNHDYLDDPEVCSRDQRKLVRVTAQVESETVFLRLLGWRTLTLQASALSETAVLDVIIVFDVSESMLEETTYSDWSSIGLGTVFVPPRYTDIKTALNTRRQLTPGQPTLSTVELFLGTGYPEVPTPKPTTEVQLGWLQVPQQAVNVKLDYVNEPSLNAPGFNDPAYPVTSFVPPGFNVDNGLPRTACTVRFFPNSFAYNLTASEDALYTAHGVSWPTNAQGQKRWAGFRPTYNFYGCCNDPTVGASVDLDGNITPGDPLGAGPNYGDFEFQDLICQPFKKARDATREFLQRIDFLRGDRVGFVLFARSAYILNPYDVTARDSGRSHMIDSFTEAVDTLDKFVGVRAEPNFYDWDEDYDGGGTFSGWKGFAAGFDQNTGNSLGIQYESEAPQAIGYNNYPAKDNCPYQNAALPKPFSRYNGSLYKIMIPNPTAPGWSGQGLTTDNSYELWASCRDTNIGAALREGNNALLDPRTSRRTGVVWVMVLLSDGAAGASDPVRRNGDQPAIPDPYFANNLATEDYGVPGQYGSLGLCPYGTPSLKGELADTADDLAEFGLTAFPFCSDQEPDTRHFCDFRPEQFRNGEEWPLPRSNPPDPPFVNNSTDVRTDNKYVTFPTAGWPGTWPDTPVTCPAGGSLCDYDLNGDGFVQSETTENLAAGHIYDVDIGDYTKCEYYDVDDYARDWADFVSVAQPGQGDEAQLPTIFTIGFGLDFPRDSSGVPGTAGYVPGPITRNPEDFLGEELLRYIADAGDNFKIDIDYQQDYLDAKDGSLSGTEPTEGWGARGVCEDQNEVAPTIKPLPPTQNCGNYFNAPNQEELEGVFDEIASRMFTRLAG